jgi:hypothetical protein
MLDWWIGINCRVPEGGVEAWGALGASSLILIPPVDLPAACFAFFWGVGVAVALHFSAWVFEAPTLALADGLLADLMLGDHVETGIARIAMFPSNPGMGK